MYTGTDDEAYLALKYENETVTFAREHPHICETMLVRVYDQEEGLHFIGYGIVCPATMRWSEFFFQYVCDVSMNGCVLHNVVAGRLEREVCRGSFLKEVL